MHTLYSAVHTEVERLQSAKRRLHLRRAVVGAIMKWGSICTVNIGQHFVQIPETTQRNVGSGDVVSLGRPSHSFTTLGRPTSAGLRHQHLWDLQLPYHKHRQWE